MIVARGGDEIYIFDSISISVISLGRESQDAWKLYIENSKFQEAYEICKNSNSPAFDFVEIIFILLIVRSLGFMLTICLKLESMNSQQKYISKHLGPLKKSF